MNKWKKEQQARLYREQMGREAAERQEDLAKRTCHGCGHVDGHHPACRHGRAAAARKARR